MNAIAPVEINNLIYHICGKTVMLDYESAKLYGVETRTINQAVRRTIEQLCSQASSTED